MNTMFSTGVFNTCLALESCPVISSTFVPLLSSVKDRFETIKQVVLLSDTGDTPDTDLELADEYEALMTDTDPAYDFPNFDENTMGTAGLPKGVFFSHRKG